MMKEATLITGLQTQRVYRTKFARYHTAFLNPPWPLMATDGAELTPTEPVNVTEKIVPITQFCRPGKPDLYIAYSEEVEELLGVPFRTLYKEVQETRDENNRLRSLTWWQHTKEAWRKFWEPTP